MYTNFDSRRANLQFGMFLPRSENGTKKLFKYADFDIPSCRKAFYRIESKLKGQKDYHLMFNEVDNSVSVVKETSVKGKYEIIKKFLATELYQYQVEIGKSKGVLKGIINFFKAAKLLILHPEKDIKSNIYQAAEYATMLNKKSQQVAQSVTK